MITSPPAPQPRPSTCRNTAPSSTPTAPPPSADPASPPPLQDSTSSTRPGVWDSEIIINRDSRGWVELTPLAREALALLRLTPHERESVIVSLTEYFAAAAAGMRYATPLRGRGFWGYLVVKQLLLHPRFYLAGLPAATAAYALGIYGYVINYL